MSVKLVNSDLENVYKIQSKETDLNFITVGQYRDLYDHFLSLKKGVVIHNEEQFLTTFQLIVIVSVFSEYDGYTNIMNPSIIQKTLDNRFKWYLNNDKFEYISTEFSILNYSLISDMTGEVNYDGLMIQNRCENNPNELIIKIHSNGLLSINEEDTILKIYGSVIFTYKYDGNLRHVLIIFLDADAYEKIMLPLFISISDEEYQKFKNILENTSDKIKSDRNAFEINFKDYTDDSI